jgi:hypothetical protein
MIPINELKAPAVGCGWHEVAALVLDAATALSEQPASDLSNLTTIHLAADGYVALPAGSESAAPAAQLARLLEGLLQGLPAPEALRAIATRYQTAPADDNSVEAFVSELARFERPDRTGILVQLAARAASVDRSVDGATALAQLASRVRADHEAGQTSTARRLAQRERRWSAPAIAAAGVLALAMAFLGLAYFVAPRPAVGPQTVAARVRAGATELVASARQVFRPAPAPEPVPQAAVAPATPPTNRRPPSTPRTRHASGLDGVVSLRTIDRGAVPAEPEVAEAPLPASSDPVVYSSADTGVTPAALLRAHLPSQPPSDVPADDIGVLELMVTETGRVAHVRLLSTSNRYQERMLVAAAKSWRFQPAMKDGRPVRFRARVRITV